jgi:hypothetical protein
MNINVKDLSERSEHNESIYGSDLYDDLENFMNELSDDSEEVIGGIKPLCCPISERVESLINCL